MSFVDQDDIIAVNERMAQLLWKKFRGVDLGPIPKMKFIDAMNRFACDKPDLRFGLELQDLTEKSRGTGFKVFDDVLAKNGVVKGLGVEQAGEMSRAQIDKLVDIAKKAGAKGLIWIKGDVNGTLTSAVSKALPEDKVKELPNKLCPSGKGLSLLVAD